MNSDLKKRIHRYGRFMIVFIIALVLFITFPFIVSFVYIVTLIFGEPVSYIAGGIVSNLYVPLLVILLIMFLYLMFRVLLINMHINGITSFTGSTFTKPGLKNILVLIALVIAIVVFTFNCVGNISNLVLDIENLATSNFAQMDGTLKLYEVTHGDTSETRIEINSMRFEGGYAKGEQLVEGDKYHVEYLPHSKYVVKYHRYPK